MKKTTLTRVLAIALALVMVLALGACGKKSSGDLTLTFQQWWADECPEGFFQSLMDGFKEETGITVELISEPYADTKTTIEAGAANGTVADIVGVSGSWTYDFVNNGVLAEMDPLIEATKYDTSNFADMWKVDGKTYAVPVVTFAYPLFCNIDILNACGIKDYPTTWSEFEEDCKIITEKGYNAYAYDFDTASPSGSTNVWFNFVWQSGTTTKTDAGLYQFAGNEGLKETCEYLKGLYDNGYIYPGAATMKEADMTSLFGNGEIAFCTCSISMISTWEEQSPNLNFTAVPVPVKDGYTGDQLADYACWAIGVSENSEHKEEAMQFIEYLLSGDVNSSLAQTKGCFPGSTAAEPDYSQSSEVFQTVFKFWQTQTPISEFDGAKSSSSLRSGILEQFMAYLLGDYKTTDDFLDGMQKVVDDIYAE